MITKNWEVKNLKFEIGTTKKSFFNQGPEKSLLILRGPRKSQKPKKKSFFERGPRKSLLGPEKSGTPTTGSSYYYYSIVLIAVMRTPATSHD